MSKQLISLSELEVDDYQVNAHEPTSYEFTGDGNINFIINGDGNQVNINNKENRNIRNSGDPQTLEVEYHCPNELYGTEMCVRRCSYCKEQGAVYESPGAFHYLSLPLQVLSIPILVPLIPVFGLSMFRLGGGLIENDVDDVVIVETALKSNVKESSEAMVVAESEPTQWQKHQLFLIEQQKASVENQKDMHDMKLRSMAIDDILEERKANKILERYKKEAESVSEKVEDGSKISFYDLANID